jgi:kynurenine formamidase
MSKATNSYTTPLNEPLTTPASIQHIAGKYVDLAGIETACLWNMQSDIRETQRLLRAALMIVRHGEQSDLEQEEIAALAAVITAAHLSASSLARDWKDTIGTVEG